MVQCQECPAECKDHKWGRIAAHNGGWFFTRSGLGYCPLHVPSWVSLWRQEKEDNDVNNPRCEIDNGSAW
jgi:hypothetical protein